MTRAELTLLVDYHYWARDRVFTAVARLTPDQYVAGNRQQFPVRTRHARPHILGRLDLVSTLAGPVADGAHSTATDSPTSSRCATRGFELEHEVRAHVASRDEAGLSAVIDIRLLNGTPGATPFWQMLQHVVNHGSYHRGQVTTLLRQLGAAPPEPLDLIAFYRLR